jgi:hypothetical protein
LVLLKMSKEIIPNFENPFLLNDFISASFDKGGEIAVFSMDSLFTLITKYNLYFIFLLKFPEFIQTFMKNYIPF